MEKSTISGILLALTAIAGCNWKLPPMQDDPRLEGQQVCPVSENSNFHKIVVQTKRPLPKVVSVVVDGRLKYDECFQIPTVPTAPLVTFARTRTGFEIEVAHYDAYETLPEETTIKVYDRVDCRSREREIFSAAHLPLNFDSASTEVPGCRGVSSATIYWKQ